MSGTSFADILKHGLATGRYLDAVGREDAWLRWRLRHHRQGTDGIELPLANGQTLLAIERRMRNGGVAGLRINITALKQAQSALRDSEARLDRAQEIAGSAVGSWTSRPGAPPGRRRCIGSAACPPEHFEPTGPSSPPTSTPTIGRWWSGWITDLQHASSATPSSTASPAPMARSAWRAPRRGSWSIPRARPNIAGTLQDITERRLHRATAGAGAEDGGDRQPHRRHGARLQQPARRDHRQSASAVGAIGGRYPGTAGAVRRCAGRGHAVVPS